jgi:Fur family peroxide stress response transcriptional regulator
MEAATKQFRKRNAILDCLRRSHAHPSAEDLHASLGQEHPDISLATVYRNLALFKKQGIIQSLGTVNGIERFDGNPEPHVHFVCSECSAVLDLPELAPPEELRSAAAKGVGGQVSACQLTFTGLCGSCCDSLPLREGGTA